MTLNTMHYSDYRTNLQKGIKLTVHGTELTAAKWAVPVVYDWDKDGKKDLLVGRNLLDTAGVPSGLITYFRNIGSDSSPALDYPENIQTCSIECTELSVNAFG
ncbi:MAG: hypothetical protein ISR96_07675 [Nitrospira sp.]|nr:hypothetical protein [Nitrospira sp.]